MAHSDIVTRYQQFLQSHEWLTSALSWTVVATLDNSVPSIQVVASNLTGGGRPEIADEMQIRETDLYPMDALFVGKSDTSVALLERNGLYARTPEVLIWLSERARVWNISWHVNGGEHLMYAANGEILAQVPRLDPQLIFGPAPHVISNDIEPLNEAVRIDTPATTPAEALLRRATAMAIIEQSTGARLDSEWVSHPHPAILIDPPIAYPLEPLGFGHLDLNLDSLLRSAPEGVRREVLLLVARELSDRYSLTSEHIAASIEAVEHGVPLEWQQREELLDFQMELDEGWRPLLEKEGTSSFDRIRTAACVAVRQALLEASRDADNFYALTYAQRALGTEWPIFKALIVERIQ
ncbi:hypothetical protein [Microbispora sp. H10670]|uniref:hypothetical protein n=1 Tax=Microbispora sp. H10670 TaxID=2729108 RepID=UPI0016031E09|nr:hypothetical protein [Microbispora sp. H10670]